MGTTVRVASILDDGQTFHDRRTPTQPCQPVDLPETSIIRTITILNILKVQHDEILGRLRTVPCAVSLLPVDVSCILLFVCHDTERTRRSFKYTEIPEFFCHYSPLAEYNSTHLCGGMWKSRTGLVASGMTV